jgi:hypothetical protein
MEKISKRTKGIQKVISDYIKSEFICLEKDNGLHLLSMNFLDTQHLALLIDKKLHG